MYEYDGEPLYCCGYLAGLDSDDLCGDGRDPFTLSRADLMFGHAALENATLTGGDTAAGTTATASAATKTVTATSRPADDSCGEDDGEEIGAAVGAPLGAVALLATGWGLWERRKMKMTTMAVLGACGRTRGLVNTVSVSRMTLSTLRH